MSDHVHLIAVRPAANEAEIAVISAALSALWPAIGTPKHLARRVPNSKPWRLSGRLHKSSGLAAARLHLYSEQIRR